MTDLTILLKMSIFKELFTFPYRFINYKDLRIFLDHTSSNRYIVKKGIQ